MPQAAGSIAVGGGTSASEEGVADVVSGSRRSRIMDSSAIMVFNSASAECRFSRMATIVTLSLVSRSQARMDDCSGSASGGVLVSVSMVLWLVETMIEQ